MLGKINNKLTSTTIEKGDNQIKEKDQIEEFAEQSSSVLADRRNFIKKTILGLSALSFPQLPAFAGPFTFDENGHLVPEDKKLSTEWIKSLYERGKPEVFTASKSQLKHIGMPVGGIACGQMYLGGDGKLWMWHIFKTAYGREKDHGNRLRSMTLGGHYAYPEQVFDRETRPVEQGAAIRITAVGSTHTRTLNADGFQDISFRGEYPIGRVSYKDSNLPVEVNLEAFSPFIPTKLEKSALPVTVMSYKVRNTSNRAVDVELAGWLENAVLPYMESGSEGVRRNTLVQGSNRLSIHSTAEAITSPEGEPKSDTVFEDFESGSYKNWKAKGVAFGKSPIKNGTQGISTNNNEGDYFVSTLNVRLLDGKPNNSLYRWGKLTPADAYTGTLTSKKFKVTHDYITFLISGGYHPGETVLNFMVDGKVVRTRTGDQDDKMITRFFDVRDFIGKNAVLQIIDNHQGVWGNLAVDHIIFTDKKPSKLSLEQLEGYGSMAWSVLNPSDQSTAALNLSAGMKAEEILDVLKNGASGSETQPMDKKQIGAIGEKFHLEAGEEKEVTFLLSWFFPHLNEQESQTGELLRLKDIKFLNRHYNNWFNSANQVADYVSREYDTLIEGTRLWNKTYYDSTLPHWLLDRSFISLNCMATNTLLWFDNGRIWGWEGVECCQGTCQHVWQYAQGMARIFPEAERTLREITDFGYSYMEDGGFAHRDETADMSVAHDGHCGTIMRVYREHKIAPDNTFLKKNYQKAKKSVQFIINEDKNNDGLLEGGQANTLDAKWYGNMGWISSLYLGAVAAGKEMALEVGDDTFVATCEEILAKGRKNIVEQLFNGEYFIHKHDRKKYPNVISSNDGCHIDQVLGQSFAGQIGLSERIIPKKETLSALESIWKYNFTPNAFAYQQKHTTIKGVRIYASEGEAGTIMTTWPLSNGDTWAVPGMEKRPGKSERWQGPGGYFDEVWPGQEYQVAAHMIQEGMIEKGLATAKVVHDRHNPIKRNPYNEIECSDHYSRSMASYGVFLAVCGFDYHGPKGHLSFDPKITPEDFKAPFTVAEGWGTFTQKRTDGVQKNNLEMGYGALKLSQISLKLEGRKEKKAVLELNGDGIDITVNTNDDGRIDILFKNLELKKGDELNVEIG